MKHNGKVQVKFLRDYVPGGDSTQEPLYVRDQVVQLEVEMACRLIELDYATVWSPEIARGAAL